MVLSESDPEIYRLITNERLRQQTSLSLIASENLVSENVMAVVGSELTNKYAEGYPHRRYYGGCQFHDDIEDIAINRAKNLFNVEHANVQPHSGSNANMAAFFALAQLGDTLLAMSLDHGGHLTHGAKVNFSGRFFSTVSYGVHRETELIDYDEVERLAQEHRPKIIIAGASAYSRTIDFSRFSSIARDVGAYLLVDMAHIAGLIAAGMHPSPAPYADVITTTTHKTLRGARGGMILCRSQFKKEIDSWIFPGLQGGPLMHEIAGKAVCLKEAASDEFKRYQQQVVSNANCLAQGLMDNGIRLVANGTDNHLVLINLSPNNVSGLEIETKLGALGIVVNKNKIPFDKKPATITSGIRLGTPNITTRGMKEPQMDELASIISAVIKGEGSEVALKERIATLTQQFSV